VVVPPTVEPVSTDEAQSWTRVEDANEIALIATLIRSARERIEAITARAYVEQRLELLLDAFPATDIILPVAPVVRVLSIRYTDPAGTEQTVDSTRYTLRRIEPAVIALNPSQSWPATKEGTWVTVSFLAGYALPMTADAATDVLTVTDHAYVADEPVQLWNLGGTLPAPLVARRTYYVRDVATDQFKLAAQPGGSALDLTDAGTGTHFVGLIPEALRQAILVLAATMYAQREELSDQTLAAVPYPVRRLVAPYRVFR